MFIAPQPGTDQAPLGAKQPLETYVAPKGASERIGCHGVL